MTNTIQVKCLLDKLRSLEAHYPEAPEVTNVSGLVLSHADLEGLSTTQLCNELIKAANEAYYQEVWAEQLEEHIERYEKLAEEIEVK